MAHCVTDANFDGDTTFIGSTRVFHGACTQSSTFRARRSYCRSNTWRCYLTAELGRNGCMQREAERTTSFGREQSLVMVYVVS